MKLVIIGSGAAGLPAASRARLYNSDIEIDVITKSDVAAYSPCGIPLALGREIPSINKLVLRDVSYYKHKRINIHLNAEALKIDTSSKIVFTDKGRFPYNRLIVATGTVPKPIDIPGISLEGVFFLRNLPDAYKAEEIIPKCDHILISSSRFLGPEVAYYIGKRGINVSVLGEKNFMKYFFDKQIREAIKKRVESVGVKFLEDSIIKSIRGEGSVSEVETEHRRLNVDGVALIETGSFPNTKIAKDAGIVCGSTGGIVVNDLLETSISDIFAAGECTEINHWLTGKQIQSRSATISALQGRIAGVNAVGNDIKCPLFIAPWVISLSQDFQFGAVGVMSEEAQTYGIKTIIGEYKGSVLARYYSSSQRIHIRLVFDENNQTLIGSEAIGSEVAKRMDMISLAIAHKYKIRDILYMETSYFPSACALIDPIVEAAENTLEKMKNKRGVQE